MVDGFLNRGFSASPFELPRVNDGLILGLLVVLLGVALEDESSLLASLFRILLAPNRLLTGRCPLPRTPDAAVVVVVGASVVVVVVVVGLGVVVVVVVVVVVGT